MTPGVRFLRSLRLAAFAVLWLGLPTGATLITVPATTLAAEPTSDPVVDRARDGRLSEATSPYLLSHAGDAIDWYPWTAEALERARRENKPIFLSIGYASCYWCHVLARTTFADERVIGMLNEHFVSILVDRDERPDLDGYFMGIMSAMIGRSGSPANFLLTPDAVPLFAAGYLAPDAEYGEPGLVTILQSLAQAWREDREGILEDAATIRDQLRELYAPVRAGAGRGDQDPRDRAARSWSAAFDETYGGFGSEPKFLRPNVLSFLLHRGVRRGDAALLKNVFRTLDHMAAGGVRDQLGGAFHRYAVDRFWQVPHFEIMLGENALLARLYLEAYQSADRESRKARYAAVARAILDDLLVRLRLPDGSFAAALDAETEGREGFYYTWTADEVRAVLGAEKAEPFIEAYLDRFHGLVQGRSVLRLLDAPETLLPTQDRLRESRSRLQEARNKRKAPLRDDKVLTSWNALAVSAFAKAAQVLNDDRYLRVARRAIRPLLVPLSDASRLSHSRRGENTSGAVFLDDYAFLVQALLDLYETDFLLGRLDAARTLMETLIELFEERPGAPFRLTATGDSPGLPARIVLDEENAPSGNAAALAALYRLVLFGAGPAFEQRARVLSRGLGRYLDSSASSATGLLRALDFEPGEAREIVIVGNLRDAGTRRLLREVYARLLHGAVLAVIAPDAPGENEKWPLLAARPLLDGKPTAYVCRNRLCDLPVNTPAALAAQLDRLVSPPPARANAAP